MDRKIREMLDKLREAAQSVGDNAERGAKYAGKKAGEIWDAGKLGVRVLELKCDISSLQEELGRLVYGIHRGRDTGDAEVEKLITALDEKAAELADAQKKLRRMRGRKVCPACESLCGSDDAFCKRCGAHLKAEER
ncbi:MAG: hypothetical protein GXX89_07970 [Clostridiales bacterium]|nr:hypothetical protein [Clostridiales bacterium]